MSRAILILYVAAFVFGFSACTSPKPQQGGGSKTTFGGADAPTTQSLAAPENSKTPSTTTIEKTTERVYELPPTQTATDGSQGDSAREQPETSPRSAAAQSESRVAVATVQGASPAKNSRPGAAAPGRLLRETVRERATTQVGTSWQDTARELGVKLANMRGVMWAGVLLLIGGPIVGIKMGWPLNGAIAGAVGLLLIILSAIIPGNEAWFGLGGLLLIPLVCFVYYRAHHDARTTPTP